jgi:hypothetical protein
MSIIIHFLNGNNISIQNHYQQKEYRDDVVVEIDGLFYEVYFFVEGIMKYEMTNDGFFSFPGLIVLDEINNDKIYTAIDKLIDLHYFDHFIGKEKFPLNNRFNQGWYENELTTFKPENVSSYKLR